MRVLVTGAAGFLGRALVHVLRVGHEGDTLSLVGNPHIIFSGTTVMYDSDGVPGGEIEIGRAWTELERTVHRLAATQPDSSATTRQAE